MGSPTLGVSSLTVFSTARSACCGVKPTSSALLVRSGSNWIALAVATLTPVAGLSTRAVMTSVASAWGSSVPTVQMPVSGSYAGSEADTNVRPAGSRSLTSVPVAGSGPRLRSVRVNVIVSPTFGVALATVLVMDRSASGGLTSAADSLLLVFGSNWSASVMVMTFGVAVGLVTRTWMVSVAWERAARLGTAQIRAATLTVPVVAEAEMIVTPGGRVSCRRMFVAVSGPRLLRMIVYVTLSPTLGVASSTILVTARSASSGSTSTLAVLSSVSGSNWSASAVLTFFVGCGKSTRAVIVSRAVAPLARLPTVQTPVLWS